MQSTSPWTFASAYLTSAFSEKATLLIEKKILVYIIYGKYAKH
ncbi:hypothetical protein NHE_0118 [Neorickettsia helminthoeca str. Oregon]|uniref:Uncharacterized protein n=1 Tax=Neorickettsia helminthoeca str. Oregon TaxID=1286528 RepID=X5H331_9RICK|nr:hypothetical protein NHE_0118 [Neorickettsia helminthoeca str. Oregon]